jgi:hypothetical protein
MHAGIEYSLFQIESLLQALYSLGNAAEEILMRIYSILQNALVKIERLYYKDVLRTPLIESCYKKNQTELRTWLFVIYFVLYALYTHSTRAPYAFHTSLTHQINASDR